MPTSAVNNSAATATALTAERVRELVRGTILERIGGSPLVPLRRFARGLRGEVCAKIEAANPGGSVKDRAALWMVLAAEESGLLPDASRSMLDATSGNTGVALAMVGAARGHAVTLCMPDRVSAERRRMAAAFGARIVATDPLDGTDGAIREARRLAGAYPDRYVYLDQYSNHAIVAAQPDSPLHGLDGLKHIPSAIRPAIWDESAADEHAVVSTDEAHALVR